MKKRVLALALAAATVATLSGGALAAETTNSTTFAYDLANEPTYSVTIPSSLALSEEGTPMDFQASDVANLPQGKKISVMVGGTDKFRDQMLVENTDDKGSFRYQIITPDSTVIETVGDGINGTEIVSFTADETKTCLAKVVDPSNSFNNRVGHYEGTITYDIAVVDQ